MTAAIQLDKALTATATLGRISSAYIDGRQFKAAWIGTRIVYPRPTAERNAGGTYDGGLNGEYDKWLAGVPWYPCLGVQHGAFPYRVTISNEAVDGTPGDTGVQYAEFIEDHAATTPYLGFYHAGFTAPAGGSKVISFTITVTDCLGSTDTYPVSLTVYAQDKSDVLDHFRVVDTTAGSNGTGTWSSPINTISGADVGGNKTLYGTSWASTTHCPKTVIVLYKNGSTIQPTSMTNMPGTDSATTNVIQHAYFPRTHIGVYGATVTIGFTSNPHGFSSQGIGTDVNDVLIKNIKFANNATASRAAVNFGEGYRNHIHDCALDTFGAADPANNNLAPFRTSGTGPNYDCTILRCTVDKPYALSTATGNYFGVATLIDWHTSLIDDITITNMDYNLAFRLNGMIRVKHASSDTEFRRITALATVQVVLDAVLRLMTGGGIGATANKHARFLLRHSNIRSISAGAFNVEFTNTAGTTTDEVHSGQVHFCSARGGMTVGSDTDATQLNGRQFLSYRNIIENSASGYTLTNMIPLATESSTTSQDITGGVGTVLNADGSPVTTAYTGLYGHTVIEV